MITEADWYDRAERAMRGSFEQDWQKIAQEAAEAYVKFFPDGRDKKEVSEILKGLLRKIQGSPPPWLVVAGPDGEVDTPDDVWIEPAYNAIEIDNAWDLHDGRNLGTMVVAVYKWDQGAMSWRRDTKYGILGDPRKTRRANPMDPDDWFSGE